MLLQVRIGPGKKKLTESIVKASRLCDIPSQKIHRVPHISLYGGFQADFDQVKRVKDTMVSTGKRYSFLPYLIDGFRWIEGQDGKVVYFNIKASEEFKKFRQELADRLIKIVPRTKTYDRDENFLFHSTLAYKLDSKEFERIWSYVSGEKVASDKFDSIAASREDYNMRYFYLPLDVLRMTLLNDQSRTVCEYDFLEKRLLSRGESSDIPEWQETLKLFRIAKGIENRKATSGKNAIFVISDLHLNYANIIEYCARPFAPSNIEEMNQVLIDNWNGTVGNSQVYFLGNLSEGNESGMWKEKLAGNIHFVKGSNDTAIEDSKEFEVLEYNRYKFLLVHDPERLPFSWHHWVIHGHKHNNDIKNYPFINGDRKTINVSPELVNYRPVSLDFLISLKLDSIKRMDTIDSIPVRRDIHVIAH
jgi:calcineurin-like phosphoesterase family protein/2'-5' RNA ligase